MNIKEKLSTIPEKPGCYLWKDKFGTILYIGKAKNLKKRTNQYFNKAYDGKTHKLVSLIDDIEFIVVDNENESLILENNLIKKYKPQYNILLKEGSNNFPYIVVTNEKNPRLLYTKKYNLIKGKYYGPFANTNNFNAFDLYKLLNKLFALRKCQKLPNKECLYYHLNQCLGPCIIDVSKNDYDKIINNIDNIFKGHTKHLITKLTIQEKQAAANLEFEKAKLFKDQVDIIKAIEKNKIAEINKSINIDIIGYFTNNNQICIIIFNYIDGKLLAKHHFINDFYNDDINEIVVSYLNQYYASSLCPKEVYLNIDDENKELLMNLYGFKVISPSKGVYLEILKNAIDNAKEYLSQNNSKINDNYNRTIGAQEELRKALGMNKLNHIEMIDNSNIFLENPVSGVVVFINGQANKKLYRKYNLNNSDLLKSDYHFMQEVIVRRYSKLKEMPDLIILDGGKHQISAAKEIINQLELKKVPKIIGLVKNDKHTTEAIIDDNFNKFELDKKSYLYLFLCHMQNEVHRFAINFFRKKSLKSKMNSFLDNIEGIGEQSKKKILKIYPNLYDLKNADIETIEQIISKKAAKNLMIKINKELL